MQIRSFVKSFTGIRKRGFLVFSKKRPFRNFFVPFFLVEKRILIDRDWVDGKMGKERSKFFYLASTTAVSSTVNR